VLRYVQGRPLLAPPILPEAAAAIARANEDWTAPYPPGIPGVQELFMKKALDDPAGCLPGCGYIENYDPHRDPQSDVDNQDAA
jgi:hypothetical protein